LKISARRYPFQDGYFWCCSKIMRRKQVMRLHKGFWLLMALLAGLVSLAACGDNTATTAPPTAAAVPTTALVVSVAPTTAVASATTAAAGSTTAAAGANPTPPLPTQADAKAEAGRLIFAKTCAGCHLGQGTQAGKAPQLSKSQNAINPDFVRNQVRNGKNKMPAFDTSKVSDADLENIIVYLKAIHSS
jgi:mono/diheme cytochrome c family protein